MITVGSTFFADNVQQSSGCDENIMYVKTILFAFICVITRKGTNDEMSYDLDDTFCDPPVE